MRVAASEELLRAVAGLRPEGAARGLSEALSSSLLHETEAGLFDFRHVLSRQAVYEAIPTPERRRLHLRAAQELERGVDPLPLVRIAHHLERAAVPKKQVRRAEEAAADQALSLGDTAFLIGLMVLFLLAHGERPRDVFLGGRSVAREARAGIPLTLIAFAIALLVLVNVRAIAP